MKKNVGSQTIGVQMTTAADGTDFAGAVTCTIAKDGAALGASGGTGPTLQATGYYEYTPTQAETNADHLTFHFTGSGAISVSVQVYTHFPQTVDNDVLAQTIKAETALIVADTGELQTNQGNWVTATGFATNTKQDTMETTLNAAATAAALATVDTEVGLIQTDLDNATDGLGALKALIDTVNTDLGNGTDGLGALKTLIDTVNTDLSNGTDGLGALKAILDTTGVLIATGGVSADALASDAVTEITAGVTTTTLTEAYPTDGSTMTLAMGLYQLLSLLQEFAITGTTITCYKLDGTTTASTHTIDSATVPTLRGRTT